MTEMEIIVTILAAALFPTITAMLGIILDRKDAHETHRELSDVRERLTRLETKVA